MHLLWLLNLRKIETKRPLDKLSSGKSSNSMGRVPELKLSFEQASQEVMVVEGIGTSSVCPRGGIC